MNLTNTIHVEFPFTSNDVNENVDKVLSLRIALTERDLQILHFILEMKFASVDEVYEKFVKSIRDDGAEVGFTYAKKRLYQLEKVGYLDSTKAFNGSRRLYFGTVKGYRAVKEIYPGAMLVKPQNSIDGRTVVHDYLILKLRLVFESEGKVTSWISDRNLKVVTGILSHLQGVYTPDAVVTHPDGTRTAIEFENTQKSKDKYKDKIKRYISWIRENNGKPDSFNKVHFVVIEPRVKKILEEFTAIYRQYFQIDLAEKFLGNLAGKAC